MNVEFLNTATSLFNRCVPSMVLAAAALYLGWHADSIAQGVASRTGAVDDVEVAGLKVHFDAHSLIENRDLFGKIADFDQTVSEEVAQHIKHLDHRTVVRLIYADTHVKDSCLFEPRKSEELQDVAADYRLQELNLATIENNTPVPDELRVRAHAPGNPTPVTCYRLTLNGAGQDTRTVLVQMFASAFMRHGPESQTAPTTKTDAPTTAAAPVSAPAAPKTASEPAPTPAPAKKTQAARTRLGSLAD